MSRWMMPRVGRFQRLRSLNADIHHFGGGEWMVLDPSARTSPSMYCMTMKTQSSSSPTSWMAQMLGWSSAAAALASLISRCRAGSLLGAALGQHLDGDLAAERGVFGEKHFAHPARAQFPDDSVMAYSDRAKTGSS